MSLQYFGQDIPVQFVELVLTKSLFARKVGFFNPELHRFLPPTFDYSENRGVLLDAYSNTGLPEGDFVRVVQQIYRSVSLEPQYEILPALQRERLAQLDRICISEDSGSSIDLLYLGNSKFFILSTNRSSIQNGDILICISWPLHISEPAQFSVIRKGIPYCPDEMKFEGYIAPFVTGKIKSIQKISSPSIYTKIDESAEIGGISLPMIHDNLEERFFLLLNDVNNLIAEFPHDSLEINSRFPRFDWILGVSKMLGIPTFVLTSLIEEYEKREEFVPVYVESDWVKSPAAIAAEEEIRQKRLKRDYSEKKKEFSSSLKDLKQRRVALFFKAEAKVTEAKKQYFLNLIGTLDGYADQGFGTKGWASSEYTTALANTKPNPGENLRVGGILLGIVLFSVFTCITTVKTVNSKQDFKRETDVVLSKLEADMNFSSALQSCDSLHKAFKPSFTKFVIASAYSDAKRSISNAKDSALETLYEDVCALLEADRGRFNSITESKMIQMLDIDEEDSRSQEIKRRWMDQ